MLLAFRLSAAGTVESDSISCFSLCLGFAWISGQQWMLTWGSQVLSVKRPPRHQLIRLIEARWTRSFVQRVARSRVQCLPPELASLIAEASWGRSYWLRCWCDWLHGQSPCSTSFSCASEVFSCSAWLFAFHFSLFRTTMRKQLSDAKNIVLLETTPGYLLLSLCERHSFMFRRPSLMT